MAVEIERRFLVKNDVWRGLAEPKLLYQGYLSVEKERTMRVRIVGDEAWVTIKGYISDVSRHEFEYAIPVADATTILEQMCPFKLKKHRTCIAYQGHVFEVDEYFDDNAPLWWRKSNYRAKTRCLNGLSGWVKKSPTTAALPMLI